MLYTGLYNIFLNVEAVHRLREKKLFSCLIVVFFRVGTCLTVVGQPLWSRGCCVVSQPVPDKVEENKPCDRVGSAGDSAMLNFIWTPVERNKVESHNGLKSQLLPRNCTVHWLF